MDFTTPVANIAKETLKIEALALAQLADTIDERFTACVHAIHQSGGRLIVTGIGKTALVARKIAATLNSTGSPAFFLHAGDAIHGDIGMIQPNDFVLALSRSGETAEIKALSVLVKGMRNPLIAMTANADSSLARRADHLLLTPFEREADPNELAPTTSTTLQMALGDALAICLLSLRGFTPQDFAKFHPGGSLGKQLYLRVSDIYPANERPRVYEDTSFHQTLYEMTSKRLGATAVVARATDALIGIITDGDVRRLLNRSPDLSQVVAADLMKRSPFTVTDDALAVEAADCMRTHSITQLIVVDSREAYLGFVHLHDLTREGIV